VAQQMNVASFSAMVRFIAANPCYPDFAH